MDTFFMLLVIPYSNIMSWCCEGIPGDVEPAGSGQELVGQGVTTQEGDQALELLRVLGANVGGLALLVLRVLDTTNLSVHVSIAEAAVDDDGATDGLSDGFQEHVAAIGHVRHVLHGGFVIRIFAQFDKFAKFKVRREPSVIDCCVFHRFSW